VLSNVKDEAACSCSPRPAGYLIGGKKWKSGRIGEYTSERKENKMNEETEKKAREAKYIVCLNCRDFLD